MNNETHVVILCAGKCSQARPFKGAAVNLSLFDDQVLARAGQSVRVVDLPFPLPERIRVISLWEPYATLVVNGRKTIETWPWPYEPSWLVIHASKYLDKSVCRRIGLSFDGYLSGQLAGMVWVNAPSRPLVPEDKTAACFYAEDRHAWPLKHARRFVHNEPFRGPQKFASVDRDVVIRSLGVAA